MKGASTVTAFCLVSTAYAATITVNVGVNKTTGEKGIGFNPSVIDASAGDVVEFVFRSGAHNVVASSFSDPCESSGGFETGNVSVSNNYQVDDPRSPTVTMQVNGSDSLWLFDKGNATLCGQGAVLAVNPTSSETADAFVQNAVGESDGSADDSGDGDGALAMAWDIKVVYGALGIAMAATVGIL